MVLLLTTSLLGSVNVYAEESGEASDLSGTITMACNEGEVGLWERVIERFHEQYPDIAVEISSFTDYTALNQNVMASHQAGSDFDVVEVNHVDTLSFIKGELLEPLSERLTADGIDVDSIFMGTLADMGKMGDTVSTSGGFQLGMGSGSQNKDLAYAFLEFVLNDAESMAIMGEAGLPTVEGAYESGTFADAEKYGVFLEQLQSSNLPQKPVGNLGEVVACFTSYWNDLCCGSITVDEMIEGAQPDVQALLDENNE